MRTHSSSNLPGESSPNLTSSNLKRRNRRRSKQPFILEESPIDTMADQRTMMELLRAPIEGYAEAIVVPSILAEQFELKHSFINMMTSDQFFRLEKDNPHDHIRCFNKITSTIKYKDVPNSAIRLMLFPFSIAETALRWLKKEPLHSILTWEDLDRYKDLLRACPYHGLTELHQLHTFYNALNPADQDSLNSAAGGNLLERRTIDVLTIIENKSKCLAADGNTFSELRDNIQGYVVAAAVNYNQGNSSYRPPGPLPSNTIANPKGELKAITTKSGIVLDGPSIPIPPPFINPKEDERVEETLTNQDLAEYTIKVLPPLVQKPKPPSQRNCVVHQRGPFHPNIAYPSRMQKQKQQEKDEVQIHKFWQMFKQLHINITLADALILILKYQKMLKALLSNKEKLLELANTPLNENCSVVILKKLLEKLGDPRKFLIRKKLGLPELISTRMTLELASQAICTPAEIARDVFVPVGKFTFPANFVIVDYVSDPRVPLILGRLFLQTARALIAVHGEEMILRDGDERLTLNMRHDTSSYSNQPKKESINMINIFNDSCEDFLEDFFATNHQSGNLTFSSHPNLTSPEVKDDIFDLEGGNVLIEKLLDLDSTKDLPPPHNINSLSGSTTSSSPNHLLEEDSILEDSVDEDNLANLNDNLVDTMPEMFTNEHALDYSSPPIYDEYDDDLFKVESDNNDVYDDPFDSKGEKIKESKLLIDELDLPRSSDFLPFLKYDSFLFEDFSEVDALPSTNNEDKVFNPGILIQEGPFEVITRVAPDKNVKKLAISHASLILKDFDPCLSLYELPFLKEVLGSETILSFLSKNEEKVFKPKILTSKGIHSSFLLEISHRGPKAFKVTKIVESPMEIFPCSFGEDIRILDIPFFISILHK
nr:hypothetical protein [Tanacetum cinerariifolium]